MHPSILPSPHLASLQIGPLRDLTVIIIIIIIIISAH